MPGGLLGADYEVANGRYRFKKVFGGLNWNPELRAPLSEPGVEVKAGEYLLAVNGTDLAPPENLYARFEATAGKIVEITVGPTPDGKGSRTVSVVPVAEEAPLRNRDWVESNLRKVDAATGGRVAYVYVPNTADLGHTYFKRYFYPQASKDAIIVDERFNGGGSVADYYIEALTRQPIAWWAMRYGEDLKTPSASIQGPKVMLIDETAGSGGDLLPWMFRHFKVGTLVGPAHVGRPRRHPRLPDAHGRRRRHGPEPRLLDAGGRLRRRERRRPARRRGRADPGRRHRRPRSAAREGDRDRDGGAEEEPAGQAEAAADAGEVSVRSTAPL